MSLSEFAKAAGGLAVVGGALLGAYSVGERDGRMAAERNEGITAIIRDDISREFRERIHMLSDPKNELKIDPAERMELINMYAKQAFGQKPVK